MQAKLRNTIVTAALPYANSDLHLGHIASTYLPADILSRYLRHTGTKVVQVCASDDFGTPILIAAEKAKRPPAEYVAYWRKRFDQDLRALGIEFDLFDRTSSPENIELVQHFFRKLHTEGYIYSANVDQFYCEFDKKFLPDRYVRGTCPYCGATEQYSDGCENCGRTIQPGEILEPKCSICGRPPVMKKSVHYFFKLSAFSARLKEWLRGNENLQSEPKNYVLGWIDSGLQDWDITRDIEWGVSVPLPEAAGKVLYGWFDNHICYISTALKAAGVTGESGTEFWNSSTIYHFIGKDIVYHHYLFLPSMRLGEGSYKLPDYIPTRGFLLLEGRKLSKSRRWGITVRDYLGSLPPDYLRFYLTRITPYAQTDANFDLQEFKSKINNELVANIGNFIHRALIFVARDYGQVIPKPDEDGEAERTLVQAKSHATLETSKLMEEGYYDRALRSVLDFGNECNKYFQTAAPWEKRSGAVTAVYHSANAVSSLAILLEPFLPFTSREIWRQLSLQLPLSTLPWHSARNQLLEPGHMIVAPKPLFKKVEDSHIEELRRFLQK